MFARINPNFWQLQRFCEIISRIVKHMDMSDCLGHIYK